MCKPCKSHLRRNQFKILYKTIMCSFFFFFLCRESTTKCLLFRVFIGIYFNLFAVTELFMLLKIVSLSHVIMVPAPTFGTRSLNWWQTVSKVPESVQSKVIRKVGGGGYGCNFLIFDSNKLSLTGILLLLQLQSRRNPHVEEWICSEKCWGSKTHFWCFYKLEIFG